MTLRRIPAGLVLAVLLVSCGGGEMSPPQGILLAQADLADRVRATARHVEIDTTSLAPKGVEARKQPLAVTSNVSSSAATQMLNFGERTFPQYFPAGQADQVSGSLVYRYYPATGIFLMVGNQAQVYVMGGAFGNRVTYVGEVGSFLRLLGGTISGLTAPGLVLANGAELLTVSSGSVSFTFATMHGTGTAYNISVRTQPTGLSCTVLNGSGTIGGSDVLTPSVSCPALLDPLAPSAPVSIDRAAETYAVDPTGVSWGEGGDGGDGGGDGGAGGGAGDGAPLARARVSLTDVAGRTVSGLTDHNGRFLLRFNTSLFQPPYVLRVVDGTGNVRTSVLVDAIRKNTAVWVNINPLTDKVVSDSLRSSIGGTDKAFSGADIDTTKVARAGSDLVASVRSALGATGIGDTSRFDPIRSTYRYDGSGVDAVLDSLNHTREPASGQTQLRSKLSTVSNNATGTEVPRLVTASAPLTSSLLALPGSEALTFAKLQRWIGELNRCLSLTASAYAADADCVDADGSRLVSPAFKSNGKDFREFMRTLFSEFDGSPVAGSQVRNPAILFVERSPGATSDDLAIVQFTVVQPYVGPRGPDGPVGGAVEYPVVTVFKRDGTLSRAKAGNWILYGNQRHYDVAIDPRYYRFLQGNPALQELAPTYMNSSLRMVVLRKRYDIATRSYVDANIRAVRVRGPGLPAGGIVLAPSIACGTSTYLALLNKTGVVPSIDTLASIVQNDFRLASVTMDGRRFVTPGGYFPTRDIPINQIPYLSDFSPIRAYSLYRFEIFLRSNPGSTTPDAVESVRILAPLMPPEFALKLPLNDLSPSLPLIALGAPAIPAGSSAVVNWSNNLLAAPTTNVSLYAEERNPSRPSDPTKFYLVRTPVPGAYGVKSVPSAQVFAVPSSTVDPNCSAGRVPAYDGAVGVYREVTLTSLQGHARIFTSMGWNR